MNYLTIYDAGKFEAFYNLGSIAPGLFMMVVAFYGSRRPELFRGNPRFFLRWIIFPFAALWTLIAAIGVTTAATRATYWARTGQCTRIEGVVRNFQPQGTGDHGPEAFEVGGVRFQYAGPVVSAGFHTPGIIREGMPVRICYHGAEILRLEVGQN